MSVLIGKLNGHMIKYRQRFMQLCNVVMGINKVRKA